MSRILEQLLIASNPRRNVKYSWRKNLYHEKRYKKEIVEWKKHHQQQQGVQDTKNNHIDKHEQDHECGEHDELFRRTNAESNELLLYWIV